MRRALRWLVLRPSLRIASPLAVALLGVLYSDGSAAQKLAALPKSSPGLISWETTKPIPAWNDFCRRHPSECAVDNAEPAKVAMSSEIWKTLVAVNRRVNGRIKPMTDKAHWTVVDRWDFPDDGYGDCEDYQLLKRKLLVERGLPRRAKPMTVVNDELGEGHALLMVRTDRGDIILDNKTSAVQPRNDNGNAIVKRESQDGMAWVSLSGQSSPTTTANR